MNCKYCAGGGFITIRFNEEVGTAINIVTEYLSCPICKGCGEQPWVWVNPLTNEYNYRFEK